MMEPKDKALDAYFNALAATPPPNGTNYGLMKYTVAISKIIESLYDAGYQQGYQDALNTDFEFKKTTK